MPRCIYCRSELNQNDPPDEMTGSSEHIVPYALGGGFTTNDAGRKCNSDLGRDIDAKFIDFPPLAIKRHQLRIRGQSGTIPPIVWPARSLDTGEPGSVMFGADGRVECTFDPVVITDKKQKYEERLVAAGPDRIHSILAGMLAKAKERGETIYSKTGEPIRRPVDFERYFEVEETDLFHCRLRIDFDVWTRGICKVILGLGHVILGEDWTFSRSGGDLFRAALSSDQRQWPKNSDGLLTWELPIEIRSLLGITPAARAAHLHTLAVLPAGRETVAVVSLFGGDGVPAAFVSLGGATGRLAVVDGSLPAATRLGVRIDPATRQTTWITLEELAQAGFV